MSLWFGTAFFAAADAFVTGDGVDATFVVDVSVAADGCLSVDVRFNFECEGLGWGVVGVEVSFASF